MEFQGKKATHDFLSLYTKDSSFQHQDSRPPSQGFYLKTHDFLKPLERPDQSEPAPAGPNRAAGPTERTGAVAHVLPGGIGTYSIRHVAGNGSAAAVKPEDGTCGATRGSGFERKPEPESGAGGFGSYPGVPFTLWEAASVAKENGSRGQWASPVARSSASFGSHSSSRNPQVQDKKRFMESGSRSSRGFDDDEEDDEEFGKREGSSHKGDLTVKVDGKSGGDQRATTPRSKHSATEQRRRSKINDRFQILRELIPHSDQKRDKASFLLEVIEYIRFLQEKVDKYESSYPGWNEENAKVMPWSNSQVPGDGMTDPSQAQKNGSAPHGLMYSGKFDDVSIPVAPGLLSTAQNPMESEMNVGVSYKAVENAAGFASKAAAAPISLQPNSYASVERGIDVAQTQQRFISDADNMASQPHSQWLRPSCPADCSVSSDMLNDQEELAIDEGTISVSTAYSQSVLNTLNQALESSGIDLSQASISVQINLGKRATSRRAAAVTTMSSAKDLDNPLSGNRAAIGYSRVGSSGEESEQPSKRHRTDNR